MEGHGIPGAAAFPEPGRIGPDTKLVRETGGGRLVHSVECRKIQDWNTDGLEPVGKFNPKHMKACPACAALVYPMERAKDYEKNRAQYAAFFTECGVSAESLGKLYYMAHARTRLVGRRMYVETRTERWAVDFAGDGKVILWHGNYRTADDGGREWTAGYHEHALRRGTLDGAVAEMTGYKYEEARKRHRVHRDRLQEGKKTVRQMLDEIGAGQAE